MVYEWYWWWPFGICSIAFVGMMLFCMFIGVRGKFKECFDMMHSSKEQELIKEVAALKKEIEALKK